MGRPTNIELRRAQLADALVGLLANGSFESITVVEIAQAAGLRPSLIHHYFGEKHEVLGVAVDRLAIQLEMRLSERLRRAGDDPRARIDAFIDAWLSPGDGADPRAARAWVAVGDEARKRPEIAPMYATAFEQTTNRLAREVRTLVGKRRPELVARAIMVAIEGALRAGAGGALEVAAAAPLVRAVASAMLNDAAAGL